MEINIGYIPCAAQCLHQKDGCCSLGKAAQATSMCTMGGCIHFQPKPSRFEDSSHSFGNVGNLNNF